tara:strand:- start:3571 stop:4170 length:600 start_codon:yes stop_codon:yes gene_type:complete
MEIIIHRVNTIKKLRNISNNFGTEIDIRASSSKLILSHEPFVKGDSLQNYLSEYKNGTLILNIKESGIEQNVLKLIKKYKIKSYFLLDVEFPYIFKTLDKKLNKNIAVRFSEYEPINLSNKLVNRVNWIWLDTYKKFPLNYKNLKFIKKFKSCLVCPERWNRERDIKKYYLLMKKLKFMPNAIMTSLKCSKIWLKLYKG